MTEILPPEQRWINIPRGEPAISREAFFQMMEKRVQILDADSFTKLAVPEPVIGYFSADFRSQPTGKLIKDIAIYINKDDFLLDGQDYTDLISVVSRHEIFEMWIYAKHGWSLVPTPKSLREDERTIAHSLALIEEYRYAFKIGKADRFLEFVKKFSRMKLPKNAETRIIQEHEDVYRKVKARLKK